MDVVGYIDSWSLVPGERVDVRVSARVSPFKASLVRLQHGDDNPAGPGFRSFPIAWTGEGSYEASWHGIASGSYLVINDLPVPAEGSLFLWISPTAPFISVQTIAATAAWRLVLDETGYVHFVTAAGSWHSVDAVRPGEWYGVSARWTVNHARIEAVARRPWPVGPETSAPHNVIARAEAAKDVLTFGANMLADGTTVDHFNGKLSAPRIFAEQLSDEQLARLIAGDAVGSPLAEWPMTDDPASLVVADRTGRWPARLVNMPLRGVTGPRFDGSSQHWGGNPDHYDAITFHADDKVDALWPAAFTLTVPDALESDVYAIRLEAGDTVDHAPFFVRPPAGAPRKPILFLAPTFSYMAYGNEHVLPAMVAENGFQLEKSDRAYPWQPEQRYILEMGLNSLYDRHADGSGICMASTHLPVLNLRPNVVFQMLDTLKGGAHQFMADLYIVDWLNEQGFDYDVATDHDLHFGGSDTLDGYDVVITGTHHEYWSGAMLDTIQAYLDGGGKLMYMSGNGFYCVTSTHPAAPHVIEIRRAHGTGAWVAAPGERHHASTGEQGGLWRDRGRPPQAMLGVGFIADGIDGNASYTVHEVAEGTLARAILDDAGLAPGSVLGNEMSLVMGPGAAGFEIDCMDTALGTPPSTTCLATATDIPDRHFLAAEEFLHGHANVTAVTNPKIRADAVLVEYPNGGQVFSTGSINWSGCLSADSYRGSVSRLTGSVLRHFLSHPLECSPAADC